MSQTKDRMRLGCLWWLFGVGLLILGSPIALYTWSEVQRLGWERRAIPAELSIEQTIVSHPGYWQAPILGGGYCAEFEMSEELMQRLRAQALEAAKQDHYGAELSDWSPTPVRENIIAGGDSAYGMRGACGSDFADAVRAVIRTPGNYYAYRRRSADEEVFVFVSPHRRRVYYIAYFGG